jgi:uncharacterized protein involved in copper resistance
MRRSPLARLLALAMGAWYATLVAEPVALHACAMHGGGVGHGAAPVAAHAMAGHDMAEMDMHGPGMAGMVHDAMPMADAAAPADAPAPASHGCTCLGCGSSSTASATVPMAPALAFVEAEFTPPVTGGWVRDVEPRPLDRRLPLAHAPPLARVA